MFFYKNSVRIKLIFIVFSSRRKKHMCPHQTGSAVAFAGTPRQAARLQKIIADKKQEPGALMPVLQAAQTIYGYLPMEVQKMIAEGLEIPLEEVYGVATFYSQFSLTPKGKYSISVCLGTACYVKGSGLLLEKLKEYLGIDAGECTADGRFSLDACRCVGACGLAPVMMVGDDVYGKMTPEQIEEVLAKYE